MKNGIYVRWNICVDVYSQSCGLVVAVPAGRHSASHTQYCTPTLIFGPRCKNSNQTYHRAPFAHVFRMSTNIHAVLTQEKMEWNAAVIRNSTPRSRRRMLANENEIPKQKPKQKKRGTTVTQPFKFHETRRRTRSAVRTKDTAKGKRVSMHNVSSTQMREVYGDIRSIK